MACMWLCCILVAFIGPTFAFSQCKYDGKLFQPYTQVYKFYDEGRDWCFVGICRYDGTIWKLIDLSCRRKTTERPTEPKKTIPEVLTTSAERTTPPIMTTETQGGCLYEGKAYSPGSEIFRGVEKNKNACYTLVCSDGGDVVVSNKRRCRSTTVPPVTKSEIRLRTSSKHTLEKIKIMTKDGNSDTTANWPRTTNHLQTTEQPRTGQSETTDVPRPGQPETMDKLQTTERPRTGQPETTYGLQTTEQPLTTQPYTTVPWPETTHEPFRPNGCYQDGKYYRPGSVIYEGYDESTDWCYGADCSSRGSVLHWDTWNCKGRGLDLLHVVVWRGQTTAEPVTAPPTPYHTTEYPTEAPTTKFVTPEKNLRTELRTEGPNTADPKEVPISKIITPENNHETEPRTRGPNTKDQTEAATRKFITSENNPATEPDLDGPAVPMTKEQVVVPTTEVATPEDSLQRTNTLPLTTIPTKVPTSPGCYENGKFYPPGSDISKDYDESSDWCYGSICNENGEIIRWDTWNCKRKTTSPPATTAPPLPTTLQDTGPPLTTTPPPPGCYENGKFYPPGSDISKDYDESSDWCYGSICNENGEIIRWDTWNCKRKTTSPPATTAPPLTTTLPDTGPPLTTTPPPPGCYENGKFYPPGSDISSGYEESDDWCYGSFCDENGEIISWDTWKCKRKTTSPPATTAPPIPTTLPDTVPPLTTYGCFYEGHQYEPEEQISEGYDEALDWCYGLYCGYDGQVSKWDKYNCKGTTVPTTTTPPQTTIPPPHTPLRCYHEGRNYAPGEPVIEEFDPAYGLCYDAYCGENGYIVKLDEPICKGPALVTTTKTGKPLTINPDDSTKPMTTVQDDVTKPLPTTTATESDVVDPQSTTATTRTEVTFYKKCFYDGRHISQGEDVYRKYDARENWCYGLVCDESASLVYWEKLDCKVATTTPRPLLSLSLESILEKIAANSNAGLRKRGSVKKEDEETPRKPKRCLYKGFEFMANQFIKKLCGEYGKCSVLFCNHDGIVVPKLLSDITRKEDAPERGFIFQSTKGKLSKGF